MKQRWARILLYAVLVGWCLLFLRCETTEKSMIRVVYLEQKEQTWSGQEYAIQKRKEVRQ